MGPIADLILLLLSLLSWVVIIDVILSWLVGFEVVNRGNQVVRAVQDFTHAVTEPLLRPIRQVVRPIGGMDVSPILLLIAIWFLQRVIISIVY